MSRASTTIRESSIAGSLFLHTLAFGDAAKGIASDTLKLSVCSPTVEPSFVEQARTRLVTESLFLDDRPGALLRFMVEPNLTQVIRRQMEEVEANELRADLDRRIRNLFGAAGGSFGLLDLPGRCLPGRRYSGGWSTQPGPASSRRVRHQCRPPGAPSAYRGDFQAQGDRQAIAQVRNNLVFVVADERQVKNMKDRV